MLPPLNAGGVSGDQPVYKLPTIIGCFIASFITFGHLFSFSCWVVPYEAESKSRWLISAVHSLMFFFWYGVGPRALWAAQKFGLNAVFILGTAMISIGLVGAGLASTLGFGAVLVGQGVFVGIGGGLATMPGFIYSTNEKAERVSTPGSVAASGRRRRRRSSIVEMITKQQITGNLSGVVTLGAGLSIVVYPLLLSWPLKTKGNTYFNFGGRGCNVGPSVCSTLYGTSARLSVAALAT